MRRGDGDREPAGDGDEALKDLAARLGTRALGRVHEHHLEIGSTNDRALAWAEAGAPHGALVTADAQSAGRGRRGRGWSSPAAGDLYFSVVVRPPALTRGGAEAAADRWGALGLSVGVGVREGLTPWLDGIALKWPNDLLWRGQKLAGILCEGRWHRGRLGAVIIGVGINVGRRAFAESSELAGRATSLALARAAVLAEAAAATSIAATSIAATARAASATPEAMTTPGRVRLLASVLAALEGVLEEFAAGGFAAIRGRYEPHCVLLGRSVQVPASPAAPAIVGVAEGLASDGALLLRPADGGPLRRVDAADVWLADEAAGEP